MSDGHDGDREAASRRRFLSALTALGAGALFPALKALLTIIPPSQVLYGTDYPFWDGRRVADDLAKGGFSAAERRAVDRDNAVRLFPRLKS